MATTSYLNFGAIFTPQALPNVLSALRGLVGLSPSQQQILCTQRLNASIAYVGSGIAGADDILFPFSSPGRAKFVLFLLFSFLFWPLGGHSLMQLIWNSIKCYNVMGMAKRKEAAAKMDEWIVSREAGSRTSCCAMGIHMWSGVVLAVAGLTTFIMSVAFTNFGSNNWAYFNRAGLNLTTFAFLVAASGMVRITLAIVGRAHGVTAFQHMQSALNMWMILSQVVITYIIYEHALNYTGATKNLFVGGALLIIAGIFLFPFFAYLKSGTTHLKTLIDRGVQLILPPLVNLAAYTVLIVANFYAHSSDDFPCAYTNIVDWDDNISSFNFAITVMAIAMFLAPTMLLTIWLWLAWLRACGCCASGAGYGYGGKSKKSASTASEPAATDDDGATRQQSEPLINQPSAGRRSGTGSGSRGKPHRPSSAEPTSDF